LENYANRVRESLVLNGNKNRSKKRHPQPSRIKGDRRSKLLMGFSEKGPRIKQIKTNARHERGRNFVKFGPVGQKKETRRSISFKKKAKRRTKRMGLQGVNKPSQFGSKQRPRISQRRRGDKENIKSTKIQAKSRGANQVREGSKTHRSQGQGYERWKRPWPTKKKNQKKNQRVGGDNSEKILHEPNTGVCVSHFQARRGTNKP